MYEHELYYVEKEIAAYNNINLPDTFKLDFNEPEYPKTVQDQILLDEHRLKHHMLNEVDLLMEYNKDLSQKATGLQGGVQQTEDTGSDTES